MAGSPSQIREGGQQLLAVAKQNKMAIYGNGSGN
jgi:hypothetical protein